MRKSIGSVFLAFVFLTILLSGCAPASTPIPPTFTLVPTNTPIPPTAVPTYMPPPTPTPTQAPWKVIKSIATKENPIAVQPNTSEDWAILTLTRNLEFSGALEMKLNMESIGAIVMVLTYTEGGGEPWWKDTKRLEIACEEGTLGVFLRDGTAEEYAFDNNANRPLMPTSNGVTTCQITVKFDQYAKNIQFFQDNKTIFLLTPEEVGNFQGGLFPDGKILKVDLTGSPKSGNQTSGFKFSSAKINELVFSVPPDE